MIPVSSFNFLVIDFIIRKLKEGIIRMYQYHDEMILPQRPYQLHFIYIYEYMCLYIYLRLYTYISYHVYLFDIVCMVIDR